MFELLTSCFDIEKLGTHEISLFSGPRHPVRAYASKKPTDLVHVRRLLPWDRSLHVIYMQRDPRDVIVSQHNSHPGEYWCDFPLWERNERLHQKLCGHPRFYVCKYENLVTETEIEQTRIEEVFPFLKRRYDFSQFEMVSRSSEEASLALGGVRTISDASIGTWHKNLPRVSAQLSAYPSLAKAVVRSGYSEDMNWISVCDGIAPDSTESVRAKHDPLRGKKKLARLFHRIVRRMKTFTDEILYILGWRKAI
ncbi:hypothetical protein [uncultured Shimia sp.]|uniref:hypothetical protein n=1 Tax=uncultured Shimia sp. TaxID=573152 RepID=UPI0026030B03|nr:hypothetical protein [uncultured Shimia sp.]